jgi:hypothetical protein
MADFANGGKIDPRATFSRSDTPPTYAAPSAVHYWSNEKHLSSENILLQSQTLDTTWASYGLHSGTPLTGSITAPDGTSTAWQLNANTGVTDAPLVYQQPTLKASTAYTASVHVKSGTASHAYISIRGAASHYAFAQIEFASPSSVSTGGAGFTGISGTVTALGSSWYRISVTCTTSSSVSSPFLHVGLSDGSAFTTSGYPTFTTGAETLLVWGVQLNTTGATDYNATTTSIHREYAPTLKSVATAGQPRFEYSTDGQSVAKGILIEGQSTNLLTNSADFGGSWLIDNLTRELAAVGPDGTLSAFAFREETNSNQKRLLRGYTAGGGNVTISVYAKLLGNTRRLVIREVGVTGLYAVFDLATSTKVSGNGSIESVGNGWHRCQLNLSSTSTGHVAGIYLVPADSAGTNYSDSAYAGDGYSGLLLAMPQAEDQSFASSYISTGTSGSTATRTAESLSVATADIPGFSEGAGTVVYETGGVASATAANQLAWSLFSSTTANSYTMAGVNVNGPTDTSVRVYVRTPDGAQAFFNTGTVAVGDSYKMACRYELDNVAASLNGGAIVSDTSGTVPVGIDTLWIGQRDGANHLNSNIKRIALYNEALSDTNLQALTS